MNYNNSVTTLSSFRQNVFIISYFLQAFKGKREAQCSGRLYQFFLWPVWVHSGIKHMEKWKCKQDLPVFSCCQQLLGALAAAIWYPCCRFKLDEPSVEDRYLKIIWWTRICVHQQKEIYWLFMYLHFCNDAFPGNNIFL